MMMNLSLHRLSSSQKISGKFFNIKIYLTFLLLSTTRIYAGRIHNMTLLNNWLGGLQINPADELTKNIKEKIGKFISIADV